MKHVLPKFFNPTIFLSLWLFPLQADIFFSLFLDGSVELFSAELLSSEWDLLRERGLKLLTGSSEFCNYILLVNNFKKHWYVEQNGKS